MAVRQGGENNSGNHNVRGEVQLNLPSFEDNPFNFNA